MTSFEIILTLILAVVLILNSIAALVIFLRPGQFKATQATIEALQTQSATLFSLQDNRLAALNERINQSFNDFNQNFNERFTQNLQLVQQTRLAMDQRLENAGKTLADVRGQLGQLSESAQQISRIGLEVRKLQDIMQNPKLRGNLGEWSLEKLLSEVLPQAHFEMQHGFRSGNKVDAVIKLIDGMVSVDAKFPLTNFILLLNAADPQEQSKNRKLFLRDVRNRIDEIAQRYILPDEGTLDFALMYIPAENVYYEIITSPADDLDICAYARQKKVIPVSPNTLYSYLMMVATGLKGMQLEKNARFIQTRVSDLNHQIQLFASEFVLVGKHINNAGAKFAETQRKLEKIALNLDQLGSEKTLE